MLQVIIYLRTGSSITMTCNSVVADGTRLTINRRERQQEHFLLELIELYEVTKAC